MTQHRGWIVIGFAGIVAAGTLAGCQDGTPQGPRVTGVRAARSGSHDPTVTGTDPTGAPQDTTLDVEVLGSGFDDGSTVQLTLAGAPTEKVRTNATRYRNPKTLIANITIAADAEMDSYDVEVTTASRNKGIGSEMFEVTAPQTVTFSFRDGADLMVGDGRITDAAGRTTYTTDQCGVNALIPGYNGNAYLRTMYSPISPHEADYCGGTDARIFKVSFTNRHDAGASLDWDGQEVDAMRIDLYYQIRAILRGDTEPRKLLIMFNDASKRGGGGNGWGEACPYGLRFDEEWGSHEVQVTRLKQQSLGDAYDEWTIEATPPSDVAACLDGRSKMTAVGYYHVPFQMRVACHGKC